jgi:hypothetical protein
MNLFFVLLAVAAVGAVSYYAYTWWTAPAAAPLAGLPVSGAYLIRSASLYGGYPTPFIYKQHSEGKYISALFNPFSPDDSSSQGIAQLSEKELRVLLDQYSEKFNVDSSDVDVKALGAHFAEAIRAHQARALLALSATDPTDRDAREQEIVRLSRAPEEVVADQIAFMHDQLNN